MTMMNDVTKEVIKDLRGK